MMSKNARSVKSRWTNVSAVLNAATSVTSIMASPTALSASLRGNPNMTDEHFMRLALKEAEVAFQEGEVPVGAVLVKEGIIVASSRNNKEKTNDPTAHAELNIIRQGTMSTGDWRLPDATLYVTKEPCVMCAGAMINARLGRLVFGCRDERYGAVTSRYQLLYDPALNHQVRVVPGVLESECADLLKKFFIERR